LLAETRRPTWTACSPLRKESPDECGYITGSDLRRGQPGCQAPRLPAGIRGAGFGTPSRAASQGRGQSSSLAERRRTGRRAGPRAARGDGRIPPSCTPCFCHGGGNDGEVGLVYTTQDIAFGGFVFDCQCRCSTPVARL